MSGWQEWRVRLKGDVGIYYKVPEGWRRSGNVWECRRSETGPQGSAGLGGKERRQDVSDAFLGRWGGGRSASAVLTERRLAGGRQRGRAQFRTLSSKCLWDDSWWLQAGKGKAQRGIVKYDLPNNNDCRGIFGAQRR